MKKTIVIILALAILLAVATGCTVQATDASENRLVKFLGDANVTIYEPDGYDVTCFLWYGSYYGGMSCIPNDQLNQTK